MIRAGIYCVYNSAEYLCDGYMGSDKAALYSFDRNDLNKGFVCDDEESVKKYGFKCRKDVPKSEIEDIYKISTKAVYKGITFGVMGERRGTYILTYKMHDRQAVREMRAMEKLGFCKLCEDGSMYYIEVYADDPELELVEERVEFDMDTLQKYGINAHCTVDKRQQN